MIFFHRKFWWGTRGLLCISPLGNVTKAHQQRLSLNLKVASVEKVYTTNYLHFGKKNFCCRLLWKKTANSVSVGVHD